jgi:hypothetical protein
MCPKTGKTKYKIHKVIFYDVVIFGGLTLTGNVNVT